MVFAGRYHVRGTLRLTGGEFELRPGTVFVVDGLSGEAPPANAPNTVMRTAIEVENASLLLTGATLMANCDLMWAGVRLLNQGIIRTEADALGTPRRSSIRDALVAVEAAPIPDGNGGYGHSTSEYYLTKTDFTNNFVGLQDVYKYVAQANEGAHYCTFSMDVATAKAPLNNLDHSVYPTGIQLQSPDQAFSSNNYAAASIDQCSFHDLYVGISGVGQLLPITNNTFDNTWYAAIDVGNAAFYLSPESIERNIITVRGQNPLGLTTSYGILGDAFINGNHISGDTPDPTANTVQQVGIGVDMPTGSTQSNNELISLDRGIEASAGDGGSRTHDFTGNLFRNVSDGLYFHQGSTRVAMQSSQLHIRCNTFENPANLTGAVGLRIAATAEFPTTLGDSFHPNGNRFGTAGVPAVNPIVNGGLTSFRYYYFGSSTQEILPVFPIGYTKLSGSGNLSSACASYANGINARSAASQAAAVSPEVLRVAQDSLRLPSILAQQRSRQLTTLVTATEQRTDYGGLESYLKTLPDPTGPVHAALSSWLLSAYQATSQPAEAARVSAEMLRHHGTDEEVRSLVQLGEALGHLRALAQWQHPVPADLLSLQAIATSGTSSAFRASHTLRHYLPACPCQLPEGGKAASGKFLASTSAISALMLDQPYPNPASDGFRVRYALPEAGVARLDLRDGLGRLVCQQALISASGEASLLVGTLADGLYTCTLVLNGHVVAARRVAVAH